MDGGFVHTYNIILKKRNGEPLGKKELRFLISGYINGEIPDYQMAAFAMAVYFRGLNAEETSVLTEIMVESGARLDLSGISGIKVDKHSTGGVGDKTTIVLVPLVSSLGIKVAKMSGRALGHTGGTIDKLESIPGLKTGFTVEEFIELVKDTGAAVVGQTGNLVPADKKLYALRDVTATVDSIPLIASSIMSKKIAAGCDVLVLDVKVGSGAFMKTEEEAEDLAGQMLDIGSNLGISCTAVLTNMDQPLGYAVGNALEIEEAVKTLKGEGPEDLTALCLELGFHMCRLAGDNRGADVIKSDLYDSMKTGRAVNKFKEIVSAQGGSEDVMDDLSRLPCAEHTYELQSDFEGYVSSIQAQKVGAASAYLGAGRQDKDSVIDHAAGIRLEVKVGDYVGKGGLLARLYANDKSKIESAVQMVKEAFCLTKSKIYVPELIIRVIR